MQALHLALPEQAEHPVGQNRHALVDVVGGVEGARRDPGAAVVLGQAQDAAAAVGAHPRGVGEDDALGAPLTRPGHSVELSDCAGEVVDEDEAPVATVLDDARVLPQKSCT